MLHIMCNMSKIPINIQGWVHRQINDGGRINITLAPHCVQLRGVTCTSLCSLNDGFYLPFSLMRKYYLLLLSVCISLPLYWPTVECRNNLESDYTQYLTVGKTYTNLYHITFICPIFTYYLGGRCHTKQSLQG